MVIIDLFKAAFENDAARVADAILAGQNPNAEHPRAGTVPLQLACQGDSLDAIEVLLEMGADPNRRFTRTSRVDGRTFRDHVPLMHVRSSSAASLLIAAAADINAADAEGNTPLAWSIYNYRPDTFAFLLSHGARPSVEVRGELVSVGSLIDDQVEYVTRLVGESPGTNARELLSALEDIRIISAGSQAARVTDAPKARGSSMKGG